jgi:hypothetical protein
MASAKEALDRHAGLKTKKDPEIPALVDIAKLIRPDDNDFDDPTIRRDRDDADLLDSTLIYASEDLTGGLFGQGANPASRWFEIKVGDDDFMKWGPAAAATAMMTQRLYASLSPAVSTFYRNAPQWFADGSCFGTGFLSLEEWEGRQMLLDIAMPLSQMFKDVDAAGGTDTVSREHGLFGRQLKQRHRGFDESKVKDGELYRVVHLVYPNDAFDPRRLGWRGAPFLSCYCSPDLKDWQQEGHFYELPYHEIEWRPRAGRTWARGVGHAVRRDGWMLQEMERTALVAAQRDAEPILLTANDTDISAADLVPNAVLEGGMGEQGKPKAQYLQNRSNMQLAEAKLEQKRNMLRKAFRFSIANVSDRPQMTAYEFAGWQEQELKLIAPNLVQIQAGLASFIARRFKLLLRARQFEDIPFPPEMAGRPMSIEFISPLAKAQKLATARSTMQFVGYIDQQIAATGDRTIGFVLDREKAHRKIGAAMLEETDILNSPDQVRKMIEQDQQARAQAAALEQGANAAKIVAEVAHAKQASSLADQRQA